MQDYVIFTDSSCDLPPALADSLELQVLPLSLLIDGKEYRNLLDGREISATEFYAKLRGGSLGTTSAVNSEAFRAAMELVLQSGKDVLYLGFSSGLSATYSAGAVAARELAEQYPERKVLAVDTLCASLGQGLMVYLAAQKKREGASIEELRDYVEANKLKLCHWFTVDDLFHLKRGGRVSAVTAVVGSVLRIKPVLHVDDEGHLINVEKAQGRVSSLKALVRHMEETAIAPETQHVFISHGDCMEDAERLSQMIRSRLGVKDILIHDVGPVIGNHSGPGTLALFFLGTKR